MISRTAPPASPATALAPSLRALLGRSFRKQLGKLLGRSFGTLAARALPLGTLVVSLAAAALSPPAAAAPEVGRPAPAFTLAGSDGRSYTLASILASGKQGVVLAWFPKAFTPG